MLYISGRGGTPFLSSESLCSHQDVDISPPPTPKHQPQILKLSVGQISGRQPACAGWRDPHLEPCVRAEGGCYDGLCVQVYVGADASS